MSWVESNVRAFLAAARYEYEPEEVAAILYFDAQDVADAMYDMGLVDRRRYERRQRPTYFPLRPDRREKDRRTW